MAVMPNGVTAGLPRSLFAKTCFVAEIAAQGRNDSEKLFADQIGHVFAGHDAVVGNALGR